jgi:hypothetical protein
VRYETLNAEKPKASLERQGWLVYALLWNEKNKKPALIRGVVPLLL